MTTTFGELGLPALLTTSLEKSGFTVPTKIQAEAIPHQLAGRDILGIAQTGSGKTAAFGLPILAGLLTLSGMARPMTARALILAPTRELAVQIDENLRKFAGAMRLSTVLVLGGVSRYHQVKRIERGVDICIATPGRLKDLVDDKKIKLNETRWLVLDEADRMLDMGFIGPVKAIAAQMSSKRQTALFSATMAPEVAALTQSLLTDPVRVEASPAGTTVAEIDQRVILSGSKAKRGVLNELLADEALERVIIFSRTKHGADRVARNLEIDGHKAAAIHGNKSQNARQGALKGFASGEVRILVATDIAARGIDVPGITHVINYELPDDAENYVHRIGRTGRNGASGFAITLCDGTEKAKLKDVEKLIRKRLPVTGDLAEANMTGVQAAPARGPRGDGESRGERGPRRPGGGQQRPARGRNGGKPGERQGGDRPAKGNKPFAAFGDGAPYVDNPVRDGEGRPARRPGNKPGGGAGKPAAAGKGGQKPRWNKGQKDAARARRDGEAPRRRERTAG